LTQPDADLHVMTFNLRCATGEDPQHGWPLRRPVVRQLLEQAGPHVLGTQEGLPDQLRQLEADLPAHYDGIGEGREGGGRGEAMQVFHDDRRLQRLEHGHYWLSDTPDVPGSQTWGGDWPRMVTWVRFRDRRTGGQLAVVNTHLEAYDASARARAAQLVRRRLAELFEPGLPVVVTGDMNEPARPGGAVYDCLVTDGPLVDTWEAAPERSGGFGTFHDYGPLTPDGDRIDWILATPDVVVRSAATDTYTEDGRHPSDHLPVAAVVSLPVTS
jgi:endonuclease/exonuclease/phosphatase family metal-dependent hydrolase